MTAPSLDVGYVKVAVAVSHYAAMRKPASACPRDAVGDGIGCAWAGQMPATAKTTAPSRLPKYSRTLLFSKGEL